jgi:hypothetical protein
MAEVPEDRFLNRVNDPGYEMLAFRGISREISRWVYPEHCVAIDMGN